MFTWFKNLFRKERTGNHGGWEPKERLIYSYFDGNEVRKIDPMPLYGKVLARRTILSNAWSVSNIPSAFSDKAQQDLVDCCREIFCVPSLGPNLEIEYKAGDKTIKTLTDMECMTLLDNFLIWTETVKKNSLTASLPEKSAEPIVSGTVGG